MSNVSILSDIIADGDFNDANRWISSADNGTDFSGWRNKYNETIAQFCVIPQNDMPKLVMKLIDRMDTKSLMNRDNDSNILITSSVYYPEIVEKLLEIGIDPYTRNADGISLFALAAELGDINLMESILVKADVEIMSDKESDSAITLAAMNEKDKAVIWLLEMHVDLDEHFITSYGDKYINELKEYSRLSDYTTLFIENGLDELVPASVKDIFIF